MIHGVFPYDGDSVRDRTASAGAAQCYHPIAVVAHPPIPRFPPPPRLTVTNTCLILMYTSTLFAAELGRHLYISRKLVISASTRVSVMCNCTLFILFICL